MGVSFVPHVFSKNEIVSFLKKSDYESFDFRNGYAYIYSHEADEMIIEAPDGVIPEDTSECLIEVLNDLDQCIRKAQERIEHFGLKNDKMFPHAPDKGFEVYGMYFGKLTCGHDPEPVTNGFSISLRTVEYYPCVFTVKFFRNDRHSFAVEEWVQ